MSDWTRGYRDTPSPGFTAADPLPTYGEYFAAAGQATLAGPGNMMSENEALSQAYDQRLAAIKNVTGIDLDNPMRGGYSVEARQAIRQEVIAGNMAPIDEKGGIPERQRLIFDQKLAELQGNNPLLQFSTSVEDDAQAIGKKAVADYARMQDAPLDPFLKFGTGLAGGMWGSRRDPLFIGSLVAGPTTAFGKIALQRIVTSAAIQGGFNAGLSLLEQPAVQAWREKLGMEHGVMPALEETATAALFGMIPGAGIQGLKEVAGPLSRLLRGRPAVGDAARLQEKFPAPPAVADTVRVAEEAVHADAEIIDTVKPPEGVPPELHDDMMGAALKQAGDPEEVSPAAVHAIDATRSDAQPPIRPEDQALLDEVSQRVEKAQPKSLQEAHEIADQVIDDFGHRDGAARTEAALGAEETARAERATAAATQMAEVPEKDPMRSVPLAGADGKPMSESAVRELGYRERKALDILAECK